MTVVIIQTLTVATIDVYRSNDNHKQPDYDEYDAGDDDDRVSTAVGQTPSIKTHASARPKSTATPSPQPTASSKKPKLPVVQDLFSFDEEPNQARTAVTLPVSHVPVPGASVLDDGRY
jgi:hypothetical protein